MNAPPLPETPAGRDLPAVEIEDLRFSYPDGREALAGVSLSVSKGERVALVGPNGAGKSTLLLCLTGILRGTGSVRVAGVTLSRRTLREVRSRVGLVFQDPEDQLFMPTVAEDVAFGPSQTGLARAEVDSRVAGALRAVGLDGFGGRSPHHLSLGEKRACALATVLSMDPEVLALDEPTSGLDPRSRRRAIRLLASLGKTCLVATHDLEMALDLCPRVAVLDSGRVVADGDSARVLSDATLMEAHGLEVPGSIGGALRGRG